MWNKIAAIAITAGVLGLAAPASARGVVPTGLIKLWGLVAWAFRHTYNYYPRRHFLVALTTPGASGGY